METISNIASAAQKAVWGEGNETKEPVAGEQGAGTAKEPYDKGNEEEGSKSKSEVAPVEQDSKHQPSTTKSPDLDNKDTSGTTDTKTASGRDAMPHTDAEREELMQKGEFPRDPNDHSGEPLKMHGEGGEKSSEEKKEDPRTAGDGKTDRSKSVSQEGGAPHGSAKGTGEEYIKSTGMAADGGDFDATNPGAGAEANRLLEEKGVHKDKPSGAAPPAATGSSSDVSSKDEKTKTSKLSKLKEKLHIGRSKDKTEKSSTPEPAPAPTSSAT